MLRVFGYLLEDERTEPVRLPLVDQLPSAAQVDERYHAAALGVDGGTIAARLDPGSCSQGTGSGGEGQHLGAESGDGSDDGMDRPAVDLDRDRFASLPLGGVDRQDDPFDTASG